MLSVSKTNFPFQKLFLVSYWAPVGTKGFTRTANHKMSMSCALNLSISRMQQQSSVQWNDSSGLRHGRTIEYKQGTMPTAPTSAYLTSSSTHTIGLMEKFTMEEEIHLYLVYKLICLIHWCEQKITEAILQPNSEFVFLIPLILGSAGFKVLIPMRASFYQWHRNVSTEPVATTNSHVITLGSLCWLNRRQRKRFSTNLIIIRS